MARTQVLLVHGLWRTPVCMLGLGRRLRAEGLAARQFGYVTVAQPYHRIVNRLVVQLSAMSATGPYAVVGYSLGGVLLRAALALVDGPQPVHFPVPFQERDARGVPARIDARPAGDTCFSTTPISHRSSCLRMSSG